MSSNDREAHSSAMEGGGAYNRNSGLQATLNLTAIDLLTACARRVPVEESIRNLVIADYGASQGVNSLAPMRAAIKTLRERVGPTRPISVVHNDQPSNDFGSLFDVLETHEASYMRDEPLVFASAVGRSFYERVLPSGSVTLGWSANSAHWLSRAHKLPPDSRNIYDTVMPELRAAFDDQCAEDWRRFVGSRADELCPGGLMVVTLLARPDGGSIGWEPAYRHAPLAFEEMLSQSVISAEDASRMVVPMAFRSRAELLAPFDDHEFDGLSVEALDVVPLPDPFWDEFQRTKDAAAFGKRWGATFRVTSGQSLASALEPDRRPAFLDHFEAGLATRLAAEPEPMNMWGARMVLVKSE